MSGGTTYKAPNIPKDNTFADFVKWQQQDKNDADKRADRQREEEKAADDARKAAGAAGYAGYRQNLEDQLRQGWITPQEVTQKLSDYATKNDMVYPGADISQLTNIYTQEIAPTRRSTATTAAYEEIFGRAPTADELKKATERWNQGYWTSNEDLRNSLYNSSEYKDKFNTSYLDNYYDAEYGKQTTDAEGKKTGQRKFKFSSNLLPQLAESTIKRTGVTTPQFGDFTGTPAEIEEQQQNIRDTRQYMLSAGLTNLQGDIDKETQKLKNEGQKEIANITSFGNVASNLVSGFWG